MYDIIFCALPYSNLDQIYSAPAILKGIAHDNGFRAKTVDFGLVLLDACNRDIDVFNRVQNYFISPGNTLSDQESDILNKFYSTVVDFFKNNPSRYIGISVFSIYTHKSTYDIIKLLRENNIPSKIVVGGRGVKIPAYEITCSEFTVTKMDKLISYGELLKKKNLVDLVIVGDGEDAIVELLNDSVDQIKENRSETFNYPLPNYDDYRFKDYLHGSDEKISFPITGSKGCVRECDFCDIKFHFGKYRFRNGFDIAKEMIYIAENYGFRKFQFTDSLVNGGLKSLEEFCTIIAEYNQNNPDNKINWNGQYICRPADQMPNRLYKLMADSGAEGLTIGAESGSNHVLEMINKKTTVEALYSELEQFRRHGITCVLLTFVGHWSETFEDFVEHCRMFIKILPYVRSGTISSITIGMTAGILEGTPGMRDVEKYQIHLDDVIGNYLWVSELNPDNNYKERIYRRLTVSQIVSNLRIPCHDEFIQFLHLTSMIELHHKHINEFHKKFYEQLNQ